MDIKIANKTPNSINFLENIEKDKKDNERDSKIKNEEVLKEKESRNYLIYENYKKMGWHLKNKKLKDKLSNRCGVMPCYICDQEKTFDEISYCRIINYNQMPYLNELETFNFEENSDKGIINVEQRKLELKFNKGKNIKNNNKQFDKNIDEDKNIDVEKDANNNEISNSELLNNGKWSKINQCSNTNHYNITKNEKEYLSKVQHLKDNNCNKKNDYIWDDNYYFKRAENVYIICSNCVSKELMVRAPKNYKMVQHHYFNKNTDYMTLKNIQYELEFKKKSLLFQEKLLSDDISNLKEKVKILNHESKKLHKNVEVEENKFKMLHSLKEKNEINLDILSSNQKQFSNDFNELMNNCSHLLSKANESFWHMNKHILDANKETNSQINMNIASLESLCDTQQVSHPCSLCYSCDIDVAINPCGHTFCSKCINKLTTKKCPHCNISFNSVLKIYL